MVTFKIWFLVPSRHSFAVAFRNAYLMIEDNKIFEKLDEVIQKKKDEIAGLNRLLGFIDHSSKYESDSKEEKTIMNQLINQIFNNSNSQKTNTAQTKFYL